MLRRPGRWLALGGLVLLGFLYWKPLHTYVDRKAELRQRQAEVAGLREQQRKLQQRIASVGSAESLTREARRLGLVKPGEKLFIVKNIAGWRARH